MKKLLKNTITILNISKVLVLKANGFKFVLKIIFYILTNILSRLFPFLRLKEDIFLSMKELDFYFSPGKSELSPYPEIFHEKIYEKDSDFIPNFGDIILDVGAHIGFFTINSAKRCGKSGKVFSFEPNPDTFKRLKRNIDLNNLSNVQFENIAISNKKGEIKLKVGESSEASTIMNNGTLKSYQNNINIKSNTLDNIVRANNLFKVDILKIDAEGAEELILKGASEYAIPLARKILIETHSNELNKSCRKLLKNYGFRVVLEIPSGVNNLGKCKLVYFSRN